MTYEAAGDELANVDVFNLAAGEIFTRLYQEFPIPYAHIREEIITAKLLGEEPWQEYPIGPVGSPEHDRVLKRSRYSRIVLGTIKWLKHNRFIEETEGTNAQLHYILTPSGLAALSAVPEVLTPPKESKPLGKQLAATAADRASSAAISNIVGQVIGAAVKGLVGL